MGIMYKQFRLEVFTVATEQEGKTWHFDAFLDDNIN